jgi:hypothetical protein
MLGPYHNLAQKKIRKNREIEDEKEKKVMSRRQVNENKDDPQSLRLLENSTTLLSRRALHTYQAAPSRRDARMMTLLLEVFLEFPPVCRGVWGMVHLTPFMKEWQRPWTSLRRCRHPTKISPDPQKTTTSMLHRAPPNSPPTSSRHHDLAITTAV